MDGHRGQSGLRLLPVLTEEEAARGADGECKGNPNRAVPVSRVGW